MNTPICDFVRNYVASHAVRLHMPGHKGSGASLSVDDVLLEKHLPGGYDRVFSEVALYDITEIHGADELYHPTGIIRESEANASKLFGCPTFYSTEGSSQCIRAMLYLAVQAAGSGPFRVLAGRNAHQTFLSAAALLDLQVTWLWPEDSADATFLSLPLTADRVRAALSDMEKQGGLPICVYLTTPDYPGHMLDVKSIAEACHAFGLPLLIDNAHGAYLHFLETPMHPMDLGADMCCDSAHKTLPVLTGGAYLHIAENGLLADHIPGVKTAMAMFGSTSPSWLILQSLDAANAALAAAFRENLAAACRIVAEGKRALLDQGFSLFGEEPMKITIRPLEYGYSGAALAAELRKNSVEPEFADRDMVVLMPGIDGTKEAIDAVLRVTSALPRKEVLASTLPAPVHPEQVLLPRKASLLPSEKIPVEQALGRIAAFGNTSCPPAVAIVAPGEKIEAEVISCLQVYGVVDVFVVCDPA